ncbi:MAG: PDZ domain-containing protein [Eubacterium sp.]|nr:PDZ domain-containing protein [Eubacterium sp.]MDD7209438.1 SpoIVB peptidase S55 domain-containing protein [Lachnospiraceae bacterium]MDY5497484.1 SpoIVB peptidase S55 domain-containing protein [Anaerobutyricum sp.]
MGKKLRLYYFLVLLLLLSILGGYGNYLHKESLSASSDNVKEFVYASGVPIGIYIKTDGILVLGIQKIKAENGRTVSPADCKLKAGDYILKLNKNKITSKKQFIRLLQRNGERDIILTIKRNDRISTVKLRPVFSKDNECYQLGIWIRNDTQGIGTVTAIKNDGTFFALGHGISDNNLGIRLKIEGGSIYRTSISSILKGKPGNPGEIIGTIDYFPGNYLGSVSKNTNGGIRGKLSKCQTDFCVGDPLPVASKNEVKKGNAYLRSSISGKSRDYTIEIEKVLSKDKNSLKSLRIKVTDPELLRLTGGIIQGLSGSPIIQNGKLAGAVTHVLVDDPTKGYGIFLENMMGADE